MLKRLMACLFQLNVIYEVKKNQHCDNHELVFSDMSIELREIHRDLYICKEQNIIRLQN